jgi:hypothetical protein
VILTSACYAALVFSICAFAFWLPEHPPFFRCLFAQAECSAALATWALVAVSTVAFLAAYYAALKASEAFLVSAQALEVSQNAFDLESRAILGQSLCDHNDNQKPRVTLYVDTQARTVEYAAPTVLDDKDYFSIHYDFLSLGRTPLEQVFATVEIFPTAAESFKSEILVGNLTSQKDAHIELRIKRVLNPPQIEWHSVARDTRGELAYHPVPRIAVQVVIDKNSVADIKYFPVLAPPDEQISQKQVDPADKSA